MSQPASQAGAKFDLRQQMPETALWVDRKRQEYGAEHVNLCIRKAMKGEPGHFYAIERGHVLGTPFPSTHPVAEWQDFAIMTGSSFAGFIAEPAARGVIDGQD